MQLGIKFLCKYSSKKHLFKPQSSILYFIILNINSEFVNNLTFIHPTAAPDVNCTQEKMQSVFMTYLQAAKDPWECMDHGLNDLPVDLPRALVWLNADIVVVDVAPRHGDLEVVGPQGDGPTLSPKVGSSWCHECC